MKPLEAVFAKEGEELHLNDGRILRPVIIEPWPKGYAPDILRRHSAATMYFHEIDAAETINEWNSAIAKLLGVLLTDAITNWGSSKDDKTEVAGAIVSIQLRIANGFKPPPHRPSHTVRAREDSMWLRDLPPDATLPVAIRHLSLLFGITQKQARDRVLRAEKELQRPFRRAKPWGKAG